MEATAAVPRVGTYSRIGRDQPGADLGIGRQKAECLRRLGSLESTASMPRAGIYCRISRDREGAGLGVERQEAECRQLCEQKGWQVVEVFADNDLSAYSGRPRPRYRDLLRAIEGHQLDIVVTWHNDRLHRSPVELEQFIPLCDGAGVTVQTVRAGLLDLSTPAGRMMARTFGLIARYESEHRSERVRSKHEQIAAKGGWSGGGLRPYGYDRPQRDEDGGRTPWRVRENEAETIREAARRVLAGESVRSVAADFRRRGIPTVQGGQWWTETLRCILYSPRIAGERWHRGRVVGSAEWPAIVSTAASARLRQLLGPRVHGMPTRKGRPPHLLTGILVCGRCGRRMKSGGSGYICRSGFEAPGGCFLSISRLRTDALVADAVLAAIDVPALRLAAAAVTSEASSDRDDQAEIEHAEAELVRLGKLLASDKVSMRAWQAAVGPLEERIKAAEHRLAHRVGGYALADVLSDRESLRERWPDVSTDRRRAIVAALVDRIVAQPARHRRWEPERVEVIWKWTQPAEASARNAEASAMEQAA